MRIGTKISLGFGIVLVLTLILGLLICRSIDNGEDMATFMAEDRIPRLVAFSDTQNDLMQAVYYTRTYFLSRNEKNLPIALEYLDKLKKTISQLQRLNKAHYYKFTDAFLSKFLTDIKEYEELVAKGKANLDNIQKTAMHLVNSSEDLESKLLGMIKMMGDAQKEHSAAGNRADAAVYTDNMVKIAAMYDRLASIVTELLVAERNQDLRAFTSIRQQLQGLFKEFEAMRGSLRSESGRKLFKEIMAIYDILSRDADSLARLHEENTAAGKSRLALYTAMYASAVDMQARASRNTTELAKNASAAFQRATTTAFIWTMAVVVFGMIVAFVITRLIVRPLAKTQHFAESVADGNLDDTLDVFGKDEIGRLADSLRTMVTALKSNIKAAHEKSAQAQKATEEARIAMGKAEEAARRAEAAKREGMLAAAQQLEGMVEIISSASTELSAQIEQSDRGATESSDRLQEVATAMNEMNATVQEVARNAGSASEASHETRRKAESGEQVVRNVVQGIDEVQKVSMQLKCDMAQLSERAQDISRIMGVISDIADQTNLLALNAAIEAARAGEAGRGFAVVADEVRKLAEKTMASTLDVSNAIRGIQESTEKSMEAFDLAAQKVGEATDLANESGAALEDIVATVDSTTDQVQAIATASEEQSAASDEINQTIAQVNDMSRMTAQAMQEATKAVSDLAVQAHNLTNLIEEMKKG